MELKLVTYTGRSAVVELTESGKYYTGGIFSSVDYGEKTGTSGRIYETAQNQTGETYTQKNGIRDTFQELVLCQGSCNAICRKTGCSSGESIYDVWILYEGQGGKR